MSRNWSSSVRVLAAGICALLCLLAAPMDVGAQDVPGAPTIDDVISRAGWLLVLWDAPTDDGGSDVTAYDLRYIETDAADKADANWEEKEDIWTTGDGGFRYALRDLINDTEYDVQVRAVNADGDGDWSATVTGKPERSEKTTATIISVRGDDGALAVFWQTPTTLVSLPTTLGFDIQYRPSGGSWSMLEDIWKYGTRRQHGITGLTNGTQYDVQVRAVDSYGDGAWSDTLSATPAEVGGSLADATVLTLETESGQIHPLGSNYFWGKIESAGDEDYFKIELTETHIPSSVSIGFWFYTLGELDTVGRLLDSNGEIIEIDDYGAVLPDPENFFMWESLEAGAYYLKVTGYGSNMGDYVLRVRTFQDTRCISSSVVLPLDGFASGMLDPEDDTDCFKLELSEQTDVVLRGSGFPDTVGELLNSGGGRIAENDDGLLVPGARNFLIRRDLSAGSYFLKVRSWRGLSDGPFSVYASEAGEPGSTRTDALPLTLGMAVGGNITSATDQDYFSITVDRDTYVRIWSARNDGSVDTDAELLDNNGNAVTDLDFAGDFSGAIGFGIEHELMAGTYFVKVTGDSGAGKYTIRATEDVIYQDFVDDCSGITSTIGDEFAGCQWNLKNTGQFPAGAGRDINVEAVWNDYDGTGVNVVVVDDGMHHQHEDLTENVDTSKNHNYDPDLTDIYSPGDTHGTAVAGIIAARDNDIGTRGVAPRATIYGYNYLVRQSDANEADAMSRNADTSAVSNNSWGPRDSAGPEPARDVWERAVRNGVNSGYGGKGVVYVWAAGNGAEEGDYSNLDEYNSFYAITSVCAVNHADKRTSYSEPGANLWVCAPSSDRASKAPGITTTDNGNRYRDDFGGTSAAAPTVAGVVALMRDANENLTWRDVKLILAASARQNDSSNTGWEPGALKYGASGSYKFNHEYGFGVVDAQAAVNLAQNWTNVPAFRKVSAENANANLSIPDAPADVDGITDAPGETQDTSLTLDAGVDFIEYIQVDTHFNHASIRDLEVELVSPSGTVSTLIPGFVRMDTAPYVPRIRWNADFRLGSAKHLGEDAAGEWTLRITDHYAADTGSLRSWKLTAYGHRLKPEAPDIDELYPAPGGFTATWKEPSDAGQGSISAYDVRYIKTSEDETDDDNWTVVDDAWTSGPLQYTASGLTVGTQYDVQVRAVNSHGDGPWSETVAVTPSTDEAPNVLSVMPGDRRLTVAWTAPTNASLGTITSYDLRYKRTSSGNTWTVVDEIWDSTTGGVLEYTLNPTDTPLVNGTSYDVQVRAVEDDSEHPWSETRYATPRGVPGAPDHPLRGQRRRKAFAVEWNAAAAITEARRSLSTTFATSRPATPPRPWTHDWTVVRSEFGPDKSDPAASRPHRTG